MTPIDLEGLRALLKKATPGPWEHDGLGGIMAEVPGTISVPGCCGQPLQSGECCGNAVETAAEGMVVDCIARASDEDAWLIVAAVNALPALLALLALLALASEQAEEIARLRAVQRAAVEAAYKEGFSDGKRFDDADAAWLLSALNGAEYDPSTGAPPAAAAEPSDGCPEWGAGCERCQGNGEIVTDWDRYRHPRAGDEGDEAVATCPDCDGIGRHAAAAERAPHGEDGGANGP